MRRRTSARKICVPPAGCGPSGGEPATYAEVVDAYIRDYRHNAAQEAEFFRGRTLKDAIRYAALCMLPDGKRHPHQYRIPRSVLAEGERNLQACAQEIAGCGSFPDLYAIIRRELLGIYGIGHLTAYDVATRIGAHLPLEPDRVYLHAGTADGARELGLNHRRESLAVEELPLPFQRLRPREIEDCLCIYKRALARCSRTAVGALHGQG